MLQFFHTKGEGISLEDMKGGDYKVRLELKSTQTPVPTFCATQHRPPSDRPHASLGPGPRTQAEQVFLFRADRTVLPGEDFLPSASLFTLLAITLTPPLPPSRVSRGVLIGQCNTLSAVVLH